MDGGGAFGPESKKAADMAEAGGRTDKPGFNFPFGALKILLPVLLIWMFVFFFGRHDDLNWRHIDWSGRVVAIGRDNTIMVRADGDGREVQLRLYGLNLPPADHRAIESLMEVLKSRYEGLAVRIAEKGKDRSGRLMALVYPAENTVSVTDRQTSLNHRIVMNGLGQVDRPTCREGFCGEWENLEKRARRQGFGLWGS